MISVASPVSIFLRALDLSAALPSGVNSETLRTSDAGGYTSICGKTGQTMIVGMYGQQTDVPRHYVSICEQLEVIVVQDLPDCNVCAMKTQYAAQNPI